MNKKELGLSIEETKIEITPEMIKPIMHGVIVPMIIFWAMFFTYKQYTGYSVIFYLLLVAGIYALAGELKKKSKDIFFAILAGYVCVAVFFGILIVS